MRPRLLTIPISHFCEKARWALDRAGVVYDEERHVQLVHVAYALASGGSRTLPVLVTEHGVVCGSTPILLWADAQGAAAPTGDRAAELAFVAWLDSELGVPARQWTYAEMTPHPALAVRFNNAGLPRWEAWLLTNAFGLATRVIATKLDVTPASAARAELRVGTVFDEVAGRLEAGGPFLFGERFGIADLTFAALAGAVLFPPGYGTALPQPEDLPRDLAAKVTAWREHPAGAYALRLYAEERRAAAAPA